MKLFRDIMRRIIFGPPHDWIGGQDGPQYCSRCRQRSDSPPHLLLFCDKPERIMY